LPPLIVTEVGAVPVAGDRFEMIGDGTITKSSPLLGTPATLITTYPVVVPVGTVTPMLVALQLVTGAATPLKATVLVPWVNPKALPMMVTGIPGASNTGETLSIVGGVTTLKFTPLLAVPPTVTTTFPVVAPVGTFTSMAAGPQPPTDADVPLKLTTLEPCVVPKFDP
jgi:hypothetical protein